MSVETIFLKVTTSTLILRKKLVRSSRPPALAKKAIARFFEADEPSPRMAVIDFTKEYPIIYDAGSKDDFTLSNAAKAVFLKNETTWEKVPGSFPTREHLQAACYNLRKKDTDPFYCR